MTLKCDGRPCILKIEVDGKDRVAVYDNSTYKRPTRFKCTCEANMYKAEVVARMFGQYLLGFTPQGAVLNALSIKVAYIDEDKTLDEPVEVTDQAKALLDKFRREA